MKNALVPQNYGDIINDIDLKLRTIFSNDEDYKQIEINFVQMTRDLKNSVVGFIREATIWKRSLKNKGRL